VARKGTKAPANVSEQSCSECGKVSSDCIEGDAGFAGEWYCLDCWKSWDACRCDDRSGSEAGFNESNALPIPRQEFFQRLELPLQFTCSEDAACFCLSSRSINFCGEDVNLKINPGASSLTISGMRCPTGSELKDLQTAVARHLSHCGHSLPRGAASRSILQLYANLAKGSFGTFTETIPLPQHIDVGRISASCNGGVLCIKLPKRIRQARRGGMQSLFGSHPLGW